MHRKQRPANLTKIGEPEGTHRVPLEMAFSEDERTLIGVLINNINIFAAEIISHSRTGLAALALSTLAKVKSENEHLLRRLDEKARAHGDQSALRLIEDLPQTPCDAAQLLTVVRRCLLASAFLGHCIAQGSEQGVPREVQTSEENRRLN
jgi:hypothetical protein